MKWYRFHNLDSTFEVIQRLYLIWRVILSWSRFEHCSESLIYPLGSHTCSLFAPFHMERWPKVKLGSHYVPLLGFIYSYFAPNIPFWSRFRLVYLYFPIFSCIYRYLYLPTFSLICPYLVIFTLNCPNLTIYVIFTLHIYSSSKTAPLWNFKAIRKLIMENHSSSP